MNIPAAVPGLASLQARSLGDSAVRVAVLDGPVDLSHPCFQRANLTQLNTLVQDPVGPGQMSRHGTHVASLIFGQRDTSVFGVAPACSGLVVPIFRDFEEGRLPQLELARAIEQAVLEGAHVINISGGERSQNGRADPLLERALRLCDENNVLVVGATGNDGCPCLHVPAALPSVLAVGALARNGEPLESSNWGEGYRSHGVLAPGEEIKGAVPGGGTDRLSGTSFATPIVSGVAALLLSIQHHVHGHIDPRAVSRAILDTACNPQEECGRYLAGILSVLHAYAYIEKGGKTTAGECVAAQTPSAVMEGFAGGGTPSVGKISEFRARATVAGTPAIALAAETETTIPSTVDVITAAPAAVPDATGGSGVPAGDGNCRSVTSSGDCSRHDPAVAPVVTSGKPSYIYALGTLGVDFGTEARRDTFRQSMPDVQREADGVQVFVSPNAYDVFQLTDYLNSRPSESTKLIWTLNLDVTPIYALEAEVAYPEDVYGTLRGALRKQALPSDHPNYVSRLSIPGLLTNRTVRLFSGQRVPVVLVQPRGLSEWNESALVDQVVDVLGRTHERFDEGRVKHLIRVFLDKVYFECRNLGQSSPDRALNFAATNAFQVAAGVVDGLLSGEIVPGSENSLYCLASIEVKRSPYCRMDSDCWDILIAWFDPENERRAKSVFQFTIDVSDEQPVSLAPAHRYLTL